MNTLLDTNILTRSLYKTDPLHQPAMEAVDNLRRQGDQLCLVPQNFYEFWVVCTRPIAQNGLGMTPAEVELPPLGFQAPLAPRRLASRLPGGK